MEDNSWDDHMRDLLGDSTPGDKNVTPGDTAGNSIPAQTPPSADPLIDQSWKRIEATLDANDQAFDESMRRRMVHYHPPYDSSTWPVFLQRFSNTQFLRVKLVMVKLIEVSALILLLITAINFGAFKQFNPTQGTDQLPADPATEKSGIEVQPVDPRRTIVPQQSSSTDRDIFAASNRGQGANHRSSSSHTATDKSSNDRNANNSIAFHAQQRTTAPSNADVVSSSSTSNSTTATPYISALLTNNGDPINADPVNASTANADPVNAANFQTVESRTTAQLPAIDISSLPDHATSNGIASIPSGYSNHITNPIDQIESDIVFANVVYVPEPKYVKAKQRKYAEFGILAQSDYNGLRMPEDRLFTSGQQIVFPQTGIMSHGFGGGFTIGIGHPVWALETGLIYSAKDFKPGRQLIVGGVFDNGSVEFEAMRLQLVSIPVQYRYRFDHEGRMKLYGLIGGGLNLIVQSDIDVQIKYHFPSLSFGANPNSDPDLAETIRETRRISEHIRDGAPFSTKSFLSFNGGAGIEYQLTKYKTLFFQGTVLYQIPDLKFSNNNGKHLRSVSLQAGVRTPLGK